MKKLKNKKLLLIVIALIAIAVFVVAIRHRHDTKIQTPRVIVLVKKPRVITIADQASVIGSVVAEKNTFISSQTGGYIAKIMFKEGEYVKQGTPLIQFDNIKIKAQLASDKTALIVAHNQYRMAQKLAKKGIVSKETLQSDHANYAAKQAQVTADEKMLADTTLRAPFSGYLGAQTIGEGEFVQAGQQLVQLVDRDNLLVKYALPAQYVHLLKVGDQVSLRTRNSNKKLTASISFIAPSINTETRTIEVHASLSDPKHQLLPGQYVEVSQNLTKAKPTLFVPEQCVLQSLKGKSVFVVVKSKAKKVTVTTGMHRQGYVEIVSGLSKNDLVITAGQYQVHDGMAVVVKDNPSLRGTK